MGLWLRLKNFYKRMKLYRKRWDFSIDILPYRMYNLLYIMFFLLLQFFN